LTTWLKFHLNAAPSLRKALTPARRLLNVKHVLSKAISSPGHTPDGWSAQFDFLG
jgi:hypothetical protein